jgi:hypothetical protein
MEKNKALKDMSIYEASAFWDEHGFSEFGDIEEVRNIDIRLIKKKYVGLDLNVYEKVRKKAKKLKVSEDVLINEWLSEKAEA